MDTLFKSSSNFASLSLKDLMEARDLFHYHLMNKKNVVATALGLHRFRKGDPWPSEHHRTVARRSAQHGMRRTLFNSEVRPNSWPCVYVFVSEWGEEARLAKEDPSDVVPENLYLPDGRIVPVCVIEARKQPWAKDLQVKADLRTPRNLLGPGSAIIDEDGQGMTRLATAGCIVRDGERYYVLSNRHAVGAPGTVMRALQDNHRPEIGVSAQKGLTREDFHKIYPHFPSSNQFLLMDVGLIDLDDVTQWKTDVPGISPIAPVLDLYDYSFSLKLITMKVVGQSAVSGLLRGEIHALFYRFKSMGGSEYISDFLIGPETYGKDVRGEHEEKGEEICFAVHHGDSGTLLFIEHVEEPKPDDARKPRDKKYYPFALLWGKEEFISDGKRLSHPFALATTLSTTLDQLDLDLVRDINLDQEYIWGWVGHYVIGGTLPLVTKLLNSTKLGSFIESNIDLLTLSPDDTLGNDPRVIDLGGGNINHPNFVPLADVPDNVWKSNVNFYEVEGDDGKRHRKPGPGSRGQADNPNHFADMDLPYKQYKTFLDFNMQNLDHEPNPADWVDYFNSVKPKYDAWAKALDPDKPAKPFFAHWGGALPFRVWQLFDAMAAAAGHGRQAEFLCAGGVLIHYVGDACQPLHTSYLSQGDPDRLVKRPKSPGMMLEADGVHSGYEDEMVNYGYQTQNLKQKLDAEIARQEHDPNEAIPAIASGAAAGKAIVKLIAATHATLPPREIVDKWVELKGRAKRDRNAAMWAAFGARTIECMARGSRYLAKIWVGAWTVGGGDQKIGDGGKVKPEDLMKLYDDPNFVPSVRLDKYPSILH
jgi:hypothetical protein